MHLGPTRRRACAVKRGQSSVRMKASRTMAIARYTVRNAAPPQHYKARCSEVFSCFTYHTHLLTCAEGKLLSRYRRSVLAPVRRPATLLSFDDEAVLLVRLGTWLHKLIRPIGLLQDGRGATDIVVNARCRE